MHSIEYPPSRLSAPWRRRDASRSGNLVCVFAYFFTSNRFFNRSIEHTEIYPIPFTKIMHFQTSLNSVTSMLNGMQPHFLEVFADLPRSVDRIRFTCAASTLRCSFTIREAAPSNQDLNFSSACSWIAIIQKPQTLRSQSRRDATHA